MQSRIKSSYSMLQPSEKKIADYILENDHTENLDIGELAEKTGTSKATVSRFSKRLGYGGFKQFSLHLARESSLNGNDSFKGFVEKICKRNADACMDTAYLLEEEKVEAIATRIVEARQVFLLGDGGIAPIIMDVNHKLLRLGILANYSPERRTQKMQATLTGPGDVAIAFDYSGRTIPTIASLKEARANGAYGISICCGFGSPLCQESDQILHGIGQRSGNYFTGTIEPRISILCVVDVLFFKLLEVMPEGIADQNLEKTKKAIVEEWKAERTT